jgi:hypothetical protein
MDERQYGEWTTYHRSLFQMKAAEDKPMFLAWFHSMREFTLAEAKAASLAMAGDPVQAAAFRTQHLALLRQQIASMRFARARAEFAELDRAKDAQACKVCASTGMVSVPHRDAIADGQWQHPFPSMAVACRCSRGSAVFNGVSAAEVTQRLAGRSKRRYQMMGLDEYEALYPNWHDLVESHELLRKSERSAQWHAEEADRKSPIVLAEVLKQRQKEGQPIAGKIGAAS